MSYKVKVYFGYSNDSIDTSVVVDVDTAITNFVKQVISLIDRGKGIGKCKGVLNKEFEEFLINLHNKVDVKEAISILDTSKNVKVCTSEYSPENISTLYINLKESKASAFSSNGYYSFENKHFIALY